MKTLLRICPSVTSFAVVCIYNVEIETIMASKESFYAAEHKL